MNYKRIYDNLIKKAKERNKIDIFETHHIIPRCIGGNDLENNLVNLTPKEHFIAHKLLCKIYGYKGIRYAFSMMVFMSMNFIKNTKKCSTKRFYRVSSKDYEECRKFLKEDTSKRFKGKIYINNQEIQMIIDKSELKQYLDNGWIKGKLPFSEEALKSIREYAKKRILTEETHIKKSKSVSGTNNPAFNTKMMNKDGINKRVNINEIDDFLNNGWNLGMITKKYKNKNRIKNLNNKNINKAVVKGKLFVHTDSKPYLIRFSDKDDYDYYINILGWKPGRGKHKKECKENNYLLTKIYMYKLNPFESKRIPIELKDLYISRGWNIGRGNYYKN